MLKRIMAQAVLSISILKYVLQFSMYILSSFEFNLVDYFELDNIINLINITIYV